MHFPPVERVFDQVKSLMKGRESLSESPSSTRNGFGADWDHYLHPDTKKRLHKIFDILQRTASPQMSSERLERLTLEIDFHALAAQHRYTDLAVKLRTPCGPTAKWMSGQKKSMRDYRGMPKLLRSLEAAALSGDKWRYLRAWAAIPAAARSLIWTQGPKGWHRSGSFISISGLREDGKLYALSVPSAARAQPYIQAGLKNHSKLQGKQTDHDLNNLVLRLVSAYLELRREEPKRRGVQLVSFVSEISGIFALRGLLGSGRIRAAVAELKNAAIKQVHPAPIVE
jgi:hypothetical protein